MSFVEMSRKKGKEKRKGREAVKEIHLIRSIFSIVSSVINAADRETSIVKKLCSIVLLSVGRGAWGKFFLFSEKGRN